MKRNVWHQKIIDNKNIQCTTVQRMSTREKQTASGTV